jgi:antitoxin component YwqK of YwqJK toxin-antitoxin module
MKSSIFEKSFQPYQPTIIITIDLKLKMNRYIIIWFAVLNSFSLFGQIDTANAEFKQFTYPGGNVSSEGYLVDGKPDGYWKTYHENGALKSEGNRVNFELQGTWKFYNDGGVITLEQDYKQGLKNGERKNYVNGVLMSIERFENDAKEGISTYFYLSGAVKKEIPFKEGFESGKGFEYAEDGRIITLLEFKRGVLVKQQKINRYNEEGQEIGHWMWWNQEEDYLSYEGSFKKGLRDGYFKYYDDEGNLIKTEKWVNGVLIEDAAETQPLRVRRTLHDNGELKTLGGYRNGSPDGVHREYDENGNVIASRIYQNGFLYAQGGIVDPQGRKQENWTYFYPDGSKRAEGAFKNDLKVGVWKYYHTNGKIEQTGKYVQGQPEGAWTWYYPDGMIRVEEFYFRGDLEGEYIEYDDTGHVMVQGEYIAGLKEGKWTYEYGDSREEGNYAFDERTGVWTIYFQDLGIKSFEGSFVDGLPDGKHVWYHPNGKKRKEGKYIMGQEQGTWIFYDEFGEIQLYIEYENGKEIKWNGIEVDELLGEE